MNKEKVYIKNTIDTYCNKKFNPASKYCELKAIKIEIESDETIYNDVRQLFLDMKFDKENIGTANWNPFSDFIKENDNVLIKPNLVMHENKVGSIDCMITNFSLIRPVIDYVVLALNGTGSIIVGDAPVQDCDFDKLKLINNLEKNIEEYKKIYPNIKLMDFRKNQNTSVECVTVKLDDKSSFSELDDVKKEYSITNYDLKLMNAHHTGKTHEYIVPKDVLNADVIINMPKPKTHRKAGMTACMKNFVGVNGNKECLPHHRTGGPNQNGDEFPENSCIKKIFSWLSKYTYKHNPIVNFIRRCVSFVMSRMGKGRFTEGSWYGNDTIWRTILDLNKLIIYTDKNGILTDKPQRTIFNICDMIVSGEKEGPLLPSDKKVGLIVAGFNQLNNDYTISQIMGFEPNKIRYIENGYKLDKLKISLNRNFDIIDENGLVKDIEKYNKHFKATDGWKDYLNKLGG